MADTGIPPFIADLTGPLFLGLLFNWALFGALTVQVYVYYLAFPNDRRFPSKAIVLFVYVYDAAQTFLITRDGFKYFGSGWGNIQALDTVGLVWVSVPIMTGIISAITQIFFAWRIYILSQKKIYVPIFIILIALVQASAGIWSSTEARRIGKWSDLQTELSHSVVAWLGGTALCDVVIAAAMLIYLSKSRTGFKHTNAIIVKLTRITIETGFITAAVAVVDLALFLAYRHVNYHLTPAIALSKLYSNSLMALMNARIQIVGGRNTGAATMAYDPTLGQASNLGSGQTSYPQHSSLEETWEFKPLDALNNLRSNNTIPLDTIRDTPSSPKAAMKGPSAV